MLAVSELDATSAQSVPSLPTVPALRTGANQEGSPGPRSALGGQNLKCWFPGVLEFKFSLFQRLKRIVNCRGAAWGCSVRKRVSGRPRPPGRSTQRQLP